MLIHFTSIDHHGRFRDCCWYVSSLEFGLDALSHLVNKGNHLLEAELIDEKGRRTILATNVFDGTPISPFLQALERELHEIITHSTHTAPISRTPHSKKKRS